MRRTITAIALAALALTLGVVAPAAPAFAAVTYTVLNTGDTGQDSLRDAIDQANNNPGPDEIHFDISGGGAQVINLVTDLPPITDPVKIKGYTQPGAAQAVVGTPASLRIVINASNVAYGLDLQTNDSVIAGLVVRSAAGVAAGGCYNDGICVTGNNNVIRGNYVGVGYLGLEPFGNDGDGIQIEGNENIVGGTDPEDRNVIAANNHDGIDIDGAMNVVQGNLIGTDANGTACLGNVEAGISIYGNGNQVGGTVTGAGNVISCNGSGVLAEGDNNTVESNRIGTDATGFADLGNVVAGVWIRGDDNRVGGTADVQSNVISGNSTGVTVLDSATTLVQGNLIGTDKSGMAIFAAGGDTGIAVEQDSTDSVISGNVIAGMNGDGIDLEGSAGTVQSNKIGTDKNGAVALGNDVGLRISGDDNLIGGAAALGNVISGNVFDGIVVDSLAAGNNIHGNLIGSKAGGLNPLGNGRYGLWMRSGGNALGGHADGEGNVIAANGSDGIYLDSDDNTVEGNLIGVKANGTAPLGNAGGGVRINGDTNRVGGVDPGAGNVIGDNGAYGVDLYTGSDNQIVANAIGTDALGVETLGNAGSGVRVLYATTNVIGSTDLNVTPNTIAFNGRDGVTVNSAGGTSANAIVRNVIVDNNGLGIDLNPNGVTANDAMDADSGANDLQNYPVVSSASTVGATTTVTWSLNSLASSNFRLEFFAVNACDGSGHGQGRTFLDQQLVTTDAVGNANGATPTAVTASIGQHVVMTATHVSVVGPPLVLDGTSEFSACVLVI